MINTKVHEITLACTWWLFAGDDKELRASCDHDLEFVPRFTSSCPVGCYQCHWSIVYRPWPWLAARLPSASSSCPSKCHGWFPDSPRAGALYSLFFLLLEKILYWNSWFHTWKHDILLILLCGANCLFLIWLWMILAVYFSTFFSFSNLILSFDDPFVRIVNSVLLWPIRFVKSELQARIALVNQCC